MNKQTDEELMRHEREVLGKTPACGSVGEHSARRRRIAHDAGIAHGWREAIDALRAEVLRLQGEFRGVEADRALSAVATLERIGNERGYV